MGGMHFLWWIFWIAIVGVIAWAIWGRARDVKAAETAPRESPHETPHETLKRRLASGECTPEEYERRKALLDRDRGGGV
ncbi:MAG: SHOCT domain-containing protein [Rubrivivax sp.]|nr:SHOCT domain-containing protein [Rubrivivax sp.]